MYARLNQNRVGSLLGWMIRWMYRKTPFGRLRLQRLRGYGHRSDRVRSNPPVCDDLRSWCEEHRQAEYQTLYSSRLITRSPPKTIEPQVHDVFLDYFQVEAPEVALARISNARLVENGLVVLSDGQFVGELVAPFKEFRALILKDEPGYYTALPRRGLVKRGDYYPLIVSGWRNYYHWNHDVLMRLPLVQRHFPRELKYVVPKGLTQFHYDSLHVMGINANQLVYFEPHQMWEIESLYFSIPYPKPMVHTPEHFQGYRDRCLTAFGVSDPHPLKRIYLSRRLDNHWRTVNEEQVVECLRTYAFEVCQPASMPFREQVELFAQAEVIVGAGAGLSNMVFAKTGAVILHLQDPTYPAGVFFTVAEALGHQYWYFFGEAIPAPDSVLGRSDIHVPIDKLRLSLDRALSHRT